jgi:predicted phage-related endonuclease
MTTINEHCEVLTFDPDKPRPLGITAFDASAIMGANNYKGSLEVWAEKTGKIPYSGPKASKARKDLKRTIAQMYAEERNMVVVYWPRTLRSTDFDFMQYRSDYFVCDRPDLQSGIVHNLSESNEPPANIVAILDVRAVGILNPSSTAGWDDDDIPMKYEAQGMHAFAVTGISRVTYAALIANEGLTVRTRTYDAEDIQDLTETEFGFWENVETKTEPADIDASESTFKTIHKMFPKQVESKSITLDGEQAELYRQWASNKDIADTSEKLAKLLRAKLELIVGDAESIIIDGKVVLTYKRSKDSLGFDMDSFKEMYPELAEEFVVPVDGSRRWTPKK